jgi:methylated-DNA-[protein]-cysteine S-methyltransferase
VPVRWTELQTAIDPLGVAVDDVGVCAVRFGGAPAAGFAASFEHPVVEWLRGYFAGTPADFDLPVSVSRGTGFEQAVWKALAEIPYGEMRTYGQIAKAVGEPDAARAVGTACNRNPLPVVVPCHRVVGAGGKLVGFGGGLWRKKRLLELEARVTVERLFRADPA